MNVIRSATRLVTVAVFALVLPRSSVAQALPAGYAALDTVRPSSGPLTVLVTLDMAGKPLSDVLAEIARQGKLSFVADRTLTGMTQVTTLRLVGASVRDALLRALAGTPLMAVVGPGDQVVIVARAPARGDARVVTHAPQFHLSGYVRNKSTSELVRHVMVTADDGAVRRESNEEGFYFLSLPPGTHRLYVRAIGFSPFDTTVTLSEHVITDILLAPRTVVLEAVAVQSTADRPDLDPRLPDMGVVRLDLKTARMTPVILGEQDAMRSLMLLPGVSSTSDASTSFNVRGGAVDQNLILLDESTLYNPQHVLGFLSVFNTDAIDDVTLYKGSIPARFGGRLSSVVDIRQREGNANGFGGSASLGLLSSRTSLEGPLPNHIGSFMIAGRRSYADLLLHASRDTSVNTTVAYFYDFNSKATIRLGTSGALIASGYLGRDQFGDNGFGAGWGNSSGTLRWNQAFGGRLFSKVSATASKYDYKLDFPLEATDTVTWLAGIKSVALKVDETLHFTDRNAVEFGLDIGRDEFSPGRVAPKAGDSEFELHEIEKRHGLAAAGYLGQEVDIGSRLSFRYGLRFSAFQRKGVATVLRYANNAPLVFNTALGRYESGVVLDSMTYGPGATVSTFSGAEPRFSARFGLTENSSLKASFARTRQYLQLISRTNSPTPLDVWEPAGPFIKPQLADQVALGYSATAGSLELSAETYFKRSSNVVDFVDGADIVLKDRLETSILQGQGRAYGLELFARRLTGPVTGWISYTLSRAEQRFPAPVATTSDPAAGINGGRYYPSPSDKTHNLSIVAVYPLGNRWTFGSTFALASGLPTTFPTSRYMVDGLLVAEFSGRNTHRLPLYHRLDLSATRTAGRGELQIGVFNVYNHFNAQSMQFRQSESAPLVSEAVQLSVFGAVPSISYTFRF